MMMIMIVSVDVGLVGVGPFLLASSEFMPCDKLNQFYFPRHPSSVHCSDDQEGRNQISEVMSGRHFEDIGDGYPSSYPFPILSNPGLSLSNPI